MDQKNQERIEKILAERRVESEASPSLIDLYRNALSKEFPSEFPCEINGLFLENNFTGDDELDYLNFEKIFKGNRWNEVDLSLMHEVHVQFNYMSPIGKKYYLPALLSFFYDMRYSNMEYYTYLLSSLRHWSISQTIDERKAAGESLGFLLAYTGLNDSQAKLVAFFLANVANLSVSQYDAEMAQEALTNYWGNFLLY